MQIVNFLTTLTLVCNLLSVIGIIYLVVRHLKKLDFAEKILIFIRKNAILLAFIVALTATSGSLFLSEGLGLTPCKLCWLQRIFMYPQAIILWVAFVSQDNKVRKYVLPLCVVGGLIALYNYYIQFFPPPVAICSINAAEDCSEKVILSYNYITIATMSFSANLAIFILMLLQKFSEKK